MTRLMMEEGRTFWLTWRLLETAWVLCALTQWKLVEPPSSSSKIVWYERVIEKETDLRREFNSRSAEIKHSRTQAGVETWWRLTGIRQQEGHVEVPRIMSKVRVQATHPPRPPPTFWTGDVLWGSVGCSSCGSSVAEIFESVPSCFL